MTDDELPPGLGVEPDSEGASQSHSAGESPGDDAADFPADDRRRELLRAVADDLRGETSESRQLAAILYRVSDLYDPAEDTSPEEIYLNVRNIMRVKANGGLERD